MNLSDMLITMSQASEIEQPGLFPFPFDLHVGFACIALVFLVFQFFRERKPYQLIMAVAIPLSLAIWLSDNRTFFYAIGITEAILLLAAFVTAIVFRKKSVDSTEESTENNDDVPENTEASTDTQATDEAADVAEADSGNSES